MDVHGPDGNRLGRVLDARFEPNAEGRLTMVSLIVGHGRPGSLLGYDRVRAQRQGPRIVRMIVHWLHRDTGLINVEDVEDIFWEQNRVEIARPPRRPVDSTHG
jgi:hypothetical protein